MKNHPYHSLLRIASLVCAIALMFESGIISQTTAEMSKGTHSYLANAIGMSASVNPTELNKITADLTAREQDLAAREAALKARQISVNFNSEEGGGDSSVFVLASILFILLVLILLNYVLDYLRLKEERELKPV